MKTAVRTVLFCTLFLAALGITVFTGCQTEAPEKEPVAEQAEQTEQEKPTEAAEPEAEEKTPGKAAETEEKVPEESEETAEPGQEEAEKPAEDDEDFVVTEEIFAQTFSDVEALINELNKTIRNQNYDKWLTFLTAEYKDYYSDPAVLREISKKPTMQKYDIRLTTLKDYFTYVVVPSRSNARLDDLVFEDNNHVKAIMIIDDQRVILYQLVKVDGEWKIGV